MAGKSPYAVEIRMGARVLKGKGASVYEALSSIERPVKITEKTFLKLSKGAKKNERVFMPKDAKRLFYPLAQRYLAKQFEFLLK